MTRTSSLIFFCPLSIPSLLLFLPVPLLLLRDRVSLCSAGLQFIIGQTSLELRGHRCQPAPQLVLFHYSDVHKQTFSSLSGRDLRARPDDTLVGVEVISREI